MSYFFRCTYCNTETPVDQFSFSVDRSCDECGDDLCEECVGPHGLCESCEEDLAAEEEDE